MDSSRRSVGETYFPGEDTFLLFDSLASRSGGLLLEVGVGSGLVLAKAAKGFEISVGVDVFEKSVREAQSRLRRMNLEAKCNLVLCDGASAFRPHSFDLIAFDPPYLPSESLDDPATDGGPGGVGVVLRLLPDMVGTLRNGGCLILILSSLSDWRSVERWVKAKGLKWTVLSTRRLFFEELYAVEVS